MKKSKSRRYEQENRNFQPEWEENFIFNECNGKALCLICKATIEHFKVSNLKRHYESLHPTFDSQYPPNGKN